MVGTKMKRMLVLLLDPEYRLSSKYRLAKDAGSTPSWAINVIKKLEKKGIVKNLKVINPMGLFGLFHELRPKKSVSRSYSIYSLGSVDKLIDLFRKSGKEYAFTTYIAENILQKHLFSHRTEAYIRKEDLEDWHKQLTAIGTYGGGNVRIIVSENDELFNKKRMHDKIAGGKFFDAKKGGHKEESEGPWVVGIPQLISDLYAEGGPAGEAADMLLEKLVKTLKEKK
ncbi:MAG: hypothetical protein V1676_07700 [Candidatus Diapherotrites archaeon]